jgi:tRNA uridine 5-carboxymethylaminomethyl modification enzyme
MSCNPAIGGLAKGHLVKEIDALGGVMGQLADQTTIQNKILNKSKGRAVWSPRSQIDKIKYATLAQNLIRNNKNITILEDEIIDFTVKNHKLNSVILKNNNKLLCKALIVTCGTFMSGLIHIGNKKFKGGRIGEKRSFGLTEAMQNKGLRLGRLKTGTPPRAHKKSIDFSKLEIAGGESQPLPFSMFTARPFNPKNIPCYLAYTTKKTHQIIKNNIHLSSMFSGQISGAGPRYCPSVEDKVVRFADKNQHQLFLEPEWEGSEQIYINGFSTSLPESVQVSALKTIKGLEQIELIRPGYAIEYDFFPSYQLNSTLETKLIQGLFCAGQINGTSGYEEAAAQGLLAGINAAHYVNKGRPLILQRSTSYIGVMVDDLITKHIDEPYRMFTSRAENRLTLRSDTAPFRLSEIALKNNMLNTKETKVYKKYKKDFKRLFQDIKKIKITYKEKILTLQNVIKRPHVTLQDLSYLPEAKKLLINYSLEVVFAVETAIKYEGYEERERKRILKIKEMDDVKIPKHINYNSILNLSNESKEKLTAIKPETLGQASRIGGVRSSDLAVLSMELVSQKRVSRETK